MNSKRLLPVALAAVLAASAVGGMAHAKERGGDQDRRDMAAIAGMKITLPQAIATAEQQAGGRAVGAEVVQEHGAARIAVEVAGAQGIKTVLVDAQTGQVAAAPGGGQDESDND